MNANDCPTDSDLLSAAYSPHGTSNPENGVSSFSGADDTMNARDAIAREASSREETAERIRNVIGDDNSNTAQSTVQDKRGLRNLAKDFNKLYGSAVRGQEAKLASFQDAVKRLGNLCTGDESLWLNITTRLSGLFNDSRSAFSRWVMIKAFQKDRAMNQQELIMGLRNMDARIQGTYNLLNDTYVRPILKFVDPIGRRLGFNNSEMATILGDYANAMAVPEKNAELLRRWEAERASILEQPEAARDQRRAVELITNIGTLKNHIDDENPPAGVISCGYTNGQAAKKIQDILDLGVTREEGEQFSAMLTDWAYGILEERARGGVLNPAVLQKFPRTFSNYVPFQNKFDNRSGSANDTRPYNPGTYHAMEGSRAAPDSAFLTLMSYSRRASAEIGMQDFGLSLAAKAVADKANKVDNGLRIYKRKDINRWKRNKNPAISQWARNIEQNGGLVVNVPKFAGGTFIGYERSYVCFDPNWSDPANHLDGMTLNNALISSPKASGGMHAFAVANSWYGQMFTRMQPTFAPVNSIRDLVERSYHLAAMTTFDERGREVAGTRLLGSYFGNASNSAWMLRQALSGKAEAGSDAARYWDEYRRMGLFQEYTPGMNQSNRTMTEIMADREQHNKLSNVLSTARHAKLRRAINGLGRSKDAVLGTLDSWNGYFNNMASFNMFVTMRKAGISAERAGNNVLESMNMLRRGSATPILQVFFPFVKPTMNSAAAMARSLGLVYDPRGFIKAGRNGWKYMLGTAMAYSMIQPLAADSLGTDEETGMRRIDALSLSELAKSIPIGIGDGAYVKIPLGFGPVQLITTLVNGADRVTRGLMTPEDFTFEVLFTGAKNMMAGNWPEFGFTEDPVDYLAQMFTPSVLNTFTQVVTNRGYFGQPITYASENSDRAYADLGRATTPPVYHNIARGILESTGIDMAPEQVRAFANGLFIGPFRILRSVIESDSQYKTAKEQPILDDHNNLFIAAIKALGASQVLSSVQNEGRTFFYTALDSYEKRVKQSGVKLTSDVYGRDPEARRAYQTEQLLEHGFTDAEAADIILLREAVQAMRQRSRDFNEQTRTTWLTANDSEELKAAIAELVNDEATVYDRVVQNLSYYGYAR